ncbi:MAG TPA: hypothetical protein VLL77_00980 [Anaerolineales bacterium]|nr:hypothetical protein [Anaerolineales bacterium]
MELSSAQVDDNHLQVHGARAEGQAQGYRSEEVSPRRSLSLHHKAMRA